MLFALWCVAACSSAGSRGDSLLKVPVASRLTIATRVVAGLGRVVVDGRGRTLYMFPPDAGSRVSCTGSCAGVWPPEDITDGSTPTAGAGVNPAALSTLADPNTGALVVTYLGYPLYRYAGDVRPGEANGQGLFNNGGPWYVLSPSGTPITTEGDTK